MLAVTMHHEFPSGGMPDGKSLAPFLRMKIGSEIFALTSYGKLERKVNRGLANRDS